MTLVFVDTNIVAYARDARDTVKQSIAATWLEHLAQTRNGRLSWQVLTEFYQVATHSRKLGMPVDQARADVAALQAWNPSPPDIALFETAWRLSDRHGFSWWDALVVAAARRCGCAILLSEDLQDGLEIDGVLRIVNPFAPDAPTPPT